MFVATRWFCPKCVEYLYRMHLLPHYCILYCKRRVRNSRSIYYPSLLRSMVFYELGTIFSLFGLRYKNDLYAYSGLDSLRTNNRYPIPHGDIKLLYKRITCEFQSRLARFRQLGFSLDGVYLHITLDFCELVRLGYSFDLLYNSWSKATGGLP